MVAGVLPRTPLGAHDAPKPQLGFAGTQVGCTIEEVGNPCCSWYRRASAW
jgi:hypothetical protein